MQVQHIDRMFNFTFEKSAIEITDAAKKKIAAIQTKIEERGKRVRDMRAER